MIIMKFGGTLMGSASAIERSASLVAAEVRRGTSVVVAVSAMVGVTDSLLALASQAEQGDIAYANDAVTQLRIRHLSTIETLGGAPNSDTAREVRELCESLRQTVAGVALLKELSRRSRDLIVSFGERLSAPLMALALENLGVRAHHLSGGGAGLLTDGQFGNARPLPEAYPRLRERLGGLLGAGLTPVVAGFIGETTQGVTTTLGRGGTDYTATIIGAALSAAEVWTWKDVDGVMSADPRLVEGARNLAQLSYAEVMELAYFGAKVLHPLAVTPLQQSGIPLRVKGAADPDHPGTLIVAEPQIDPAHPVKAVTAIRNLAVLTVGGAGLVGVPDAFGQIFQVLAREEINVHMISQGNSQATLSLVVSQPDARRAAEVLKRDLGNSGYPRELHLQENVAVVAVVGEGMRGSRGVAARLFGAVAQANVNLLMIAQGSSELNISFAIENRDVEAAVRAAHAAFELGAQLRPA
ncbi:aspartate kinase [Deinococcus peraridilitoris]|uniref:Aspartokinase n=1 Tax=Deinococcus peraridilitoris (strain DSM 19664 / LMG 22246 / CIP 109416 / KR-200) TaxID=937777 RepID=L0A7W0_DEIPD|nr:aspartate kinase [Deinococcus peraridilitoris]AFZ69120.1 aspartate kinase, monofunctional class [Deinococcus peraridilitoris DSM 19664]